MDTNIGILKFIFYLFLFNVLVFIGIIITVAGLIIGCLEYYLLIKPCLQHSMKGVSW